MQSSYRFNFLLTALQQAGHVGLWAGMYVSGAYICFWQLAGAGPAGSWPALSAVVGVLLCATAVYAFDRVKLHDRLIDPADQTANPERYRFLGKYSLVVRSLAVVLIVLAMTFAYLASRWMPVLVALAVMGVVLYAPGPKGKYPRPKDLLIVKNLLVAIAVVMLAMIATALVGPLSHVHGEAFWKLAEVRIHAVLPAVFVLMIRVIADAALCDIDDTKSDLQHGTQTLSTRFGSARSFLIALIMRLVFGIMILTLIEAQLQVRLVFASVNMGSILMLVIRRKSAMKDYVDISLPVEAIISTLLLKALNAVLTVNY